MLICECQEGIQSLNLSLHYEICLNAAVSRGKIVVQFVLGWGCYHRSGHFSNAQNSHLFFVRAFFCFLVQHHEPQYTLSVNFCFLKHKWCPETEESNERPLRVELFYTSWTLERGKFTCNCDWVSQNALWNLWLIYLSVPWKTGFIVLRVWRARKEVTSLISSGGWFHTETAASVLSHWRSNSLALNYHGLVMTKPAQSLYEVI